jgi:hypothetical protein
VAQLFLLQVPMALKRSTAVWVARHPEQYCWTQVWTSVAVLQFVEMHSSRPEQSWFARQLLMGVQHFVVAHAPQGSVASKTSVQVAP